MWFRGQHKLPAGSFTACLCCQFICPGSVSINVRANHCYGTNIIYLTPDSHWALCSLWGYVSGGICILGVKHLGCQAKEAVKYLLFLTEMSVSVLFPVLRHTNSHCVLKKCVISSLPCHLRVRLKTLDEDTSYTEFQGGASSFRRRSCQSVIPFNAFFIDVSWTQKKLGHLTSSIQNTVEFLIEFLTEFSGTVMCNVQLWDYESWVTV